MHLLTHRIVILLVLALTVISTTASATTIRVSPHNPEATNADASGLDTFGQSPTPRELDSLGPPVPDPEYGIENETFYALWSGDTDNTENEDVSGLGFDFEENMRELASRTDIPFDAPPPAVEVWNTGEHQAFDGRDPTQSLYPRGVEREHGQYVRDAYVELFTITPSTRVIEGTEQTLLVPLSGSVRGIIDYRVRLPSRVSTNTTRRRARLLGHEINSTQLLVDGTPVANTTRTHRPSFSYTGLDDPTRQSNRHVIGLSARISALVEVRESTCIASNSSGACTSWATNTSTKRESIIVSTSKEVEVSTPRVVGERARFPDDTQGFSLEISEPWAAIESPTGVIRSRWKFFTMRPPNWTSFTQATTSGREHIDAPVQPLNTYAYPSTRGARSTEEWSGPSLEAISGPELNSPSLPVNAAFGVPTEAYTRADHVVLNSESPREFEGSIRTLIANESLPIHTEDLPVREIQETTLQIHVVEHTATETILDVTLTETLTGEPLPSRAGTLTIEDTPVGIPRSGDARVRIPREDGVITARFEPTEWWDTTATTDRKETTERTEDPPAFGASADRVYAEATSLDVLGVASGVVLPVSVFLLGVFVIDRITGWRIWPPWRGL
ncbi:hypothetical protein [Halobacterium wangiae]|uniref:hypothetical protein n=1 Tax=Halobacterium wangiae TaxID=2902623 RepID=UPI001E420E55|nr:hypothetical protein [Halobacterium wangiae]